jgi:pimeloyl-ACP methyl ester carboxylesterase
MMDDRAIGSAHSKMSEHYCEEGEYATRTQGHTDELSWYAPPKSVLCLILITCALGCQDGSSDATPASDSAVAVADGAVSDARAMDSAVMADMTTKNDVSVSTDATVFDDAGMLPPMAACDDSQPPVVMAHGFLGSGDTWAKQVQRFAANGLCGNRFYAFDWNSLDRDADHDATLDTFIDTVRGRHEADQVDLFGHSAGGGLGYAYLIDPRHASKVRKYVHIASFPNEGPAGPADSPVPTLNLWSSADTVVAGMDIPGASNTELADTDHYAVATSADSFRVIYQFLYGEDPMATEAASKARSRLQGRLVSLGENTPQSGGSVEVWALDPHTGRRTHATRRFLVGDDGLWGPMGVEAEQYYEFVGKTADAGDPIVRYFREPFRADQWLAYVRTFPGPGSIAGVLTTLIPQAEDKSSVVVFNSSRAFLAGQDSLTLDGRELLTEQSASAANTSIALFLFDIDNDNEPGGQSVLFDMFPFLAAVDVPMEAVDDEFMTLNFNGRILHLPKAPGSTGILIAVFD